MANSLAAVTLAVLVLLTVAYIAFQAGADKVLKSIENDDAEEKP